MAGKQVSEKTKARVIIEKLTRLDLYQVNLQIKFTTPIAKQ
jgi:hypothetical protein